MPTLNVHLTFTSQTAVSVQGRLYPRPKQVLIAALDSLNWYVAVHSIEYSVISIAFLLLRARVNLSIQGDFFQDSRCYASVQNNLLEHVDNREQVRHLLRLVENEHAVDPVVEEHFDHVAQRIVHRE